MNNLRMGAQAVVIAIGTALLVLVMAGATERIDTTDAPPLTGVSYAHDKDGVKRYAIKSLNKELVEVKATVIEAKGNTVILQFEERTIAELIRPYLEE